MTDKAFTIENLLGLPRLSGLTLSPDGSRLVVSVARPDDEGKKYVDALYELDPVGERASRRLTRSAPGESGAAFAPDGSLLFLSSRPDPDAGKDEGEAREDRAALWLLPAGGGEARMLAGPPGGVDAVAVSREDGALVFAAGSHPETGGWEEDAAREKARRDAGVGAQLFTGYPIRLWDHYLGPRERHLHLIPRPEDEAPAGTGKDLIPAPARSLDMATFDLTPDARTVVTSRWREAGDPRERALELVAVDAASGEERVLAGEDDAWYGSPACAPHGQSVVAVRRGIPTPEEVADTTLWLVDLQTGAGRDLLEGFDLWPQAPVWAPDSGAVFFTADEDGRTPAFRVDLDTGAVIRLAREGAFDSLCPAPDGRTVYALRSTVTEPPHPVALDARGAGLRRLRGFPEIDDLSLPASVERVTVEAEDGTPVPSWLLLPPGASAETSAPLAVFVHGGPVNSWSGWHWRWNPNVFVDDGWAVLLPDPALSTGYGLGYIRRGWGRWGDVVYGDLMSAADAAVGREEVDGGTTVAMGGSFGGYMANWIAGHTDRFDALVTHASLWDLESFHGATDLGVWWEREFGDPYADPSRYREHSPHLHVGNIETPMLVVHGELDYRVPIGEALTLWTDLKRHDVPAKFLYFPDENHWILKPNNARLWYETVMGFIDHHARGREWTRPSLL
ncbi:MAG: Alanyl dipeptidyl peptidase [uncultured Rubrobacteraceae bacterium]|uniref:Alanyl dipeptidyl peptidase n=1 Tax=uncultured Rubrobacteraceae bacterium TaxID=349277 RepID=A0A6J4PHW4_9ACTN|nr:MAG: Alanyl dipeptidyl peptidase [uncultured Rubrobacteraceae bacterium]